MTLFRRHAVDFEAVKFNGENFDEIRQFVGTHPSGDWDIDANQPHVINNFDPIGTYLSDNLYKKEDPKPKGELWVESARRRRPVYIGEWIVQDEESFISVTDEWMTLNCVKLDEETLAILRQQEEPKTFGQELVELLNKHSMENYSGTPDWVLGNFLEMVLRQFDCAVKLRADWRGESVELPALQSLRGRNGEAERLFETIKKLQDEGIIHVSQSIKESDIYREIMDSKEPDPDYVVAPGALDGNDGKEVPLVIYTDGQRNEIGTAKINVTPGETSVTGTIIAGALPVFEQMISDPSTAYSIDMGTTGEPREAVVIPPLNVPNDDINEGPSTGPEGRFERYQKRGLSS